ncbi:unnamed protein product [Caenorhabditis angaria]|uniref:Serpentine receptor class gamma n=1 Tax=Caenorhabditis angaria TaxID=860376 RepID=A0A9P1N9Q8_9PELO|nr:unnamed protein product [Caenorhabditis angaria]
MLAYPLLLTCFYGGITFLVYTILIFIIIANWKHFNSTYYKLFIVDYFFNLLTFLNSFITLRIPQNTCAKCDLTDLLSLHTKDNYSDFPLYIFYTLQYGMAYVQYSMILLFSFNRFTSVYFLNNREWLWSKIWVYLIILICLFSFFLTSDLLKFRVYYSYYETLDYFSTQSEGDVLGTFRILIYFMIIVTCITAVLNISSVYHLYELTSKISRAETNLILVSFWSFIIQLFAIIIMSVQSFGMNSNNETSPWARFTVRIIPYVSDTLTLGQPWLLLVFSKTTRTLISRIGKNVFKWNPTSVYNIQNDIL